MTPLIRASPTLTSARQKATLHGLRHTNGSLLLLNGVPPIQVAAHLGHDQQTLNNVYAHELDPTNRQEVIAETVGTIYG